MLAVSALLSALALGFCSLPGSVQALIDTVELDYGTFVGSRNESSGVISYRGIRFAEPPVGDLRWRLPVMPPTTHQGVVNASEYGPTCITTKLAGSTIPSTMSEDCLFGNIYVPVGTNETSNLPVLIYYHGGGYQAGSARSAPPEWLLASSKEPFIFATFQYRLGQFGFLGGAALGVNGVVNAGLLDQRASMRWVQRYISSFGGDKSCVTIWGQSAGSGSTMFHLIANGGNNEGLFHRAMGDSPALSAMPNYYEPLADTVFARFATLAGCDVLGTQDVMVCLRAANVTDLAAAGNATARFFTSRLFIFSPIVDGNFIRERPVSAFRAGRFAKVPLFFGSNTDEGANWSAGLSDPLANAATPGATSYNAYGFLRGQYADLTPTTFLRASQLYQQEEFNSSYARLVQQMYGEMRFICTAGLITGSAAAAGVDAYQYHYDNPRLGSFHHDELQAMYSTEQVDTEEEDDVMFEKMRQYWTSFATKGKPSADDGPEWKPSGGYFGEPRMLLNPSNVEMEEIGNDLASRCRLWHDVHLELLT